MKHSELNDEQILTLVKEAEPSPSPVCIAPTTSRGRPTTAGKRGVTASIGLEDAERESAAECLLIGLRTATSRYQPRLNAANEKFVEQLHTHAGAIRKDIPPGYQVNLARGIQRTIRPMLKRSSWAMRSRVVAR